MANNLEKIIINNIEEEESVDKKFGFDYGYSNMEQLDLPRGRDWEPEEAPVDDVGQGEAAKPKEEPTEPIEEKKVAPSKAKKQTEDWVPSDKSEPFTRKDYDFYDKFMTDVDRENLSINIKKFSFFNPELKKEQVYEKAFRETVKHYDQERKDIKNTPIRPIKEQKLFHNFGNELKQVPKELGRGGVAGTLGLAESVGTVARYIGKRLEPEALTFEQMPANEKAEVISMKAIVQKRDGLTPEQAQIRAMSIVNEQHMKPAEGLSDTLVQQGELIEKYWGEASEMWGPPDKISNKNVVDDPHLLGSPVWWAYNIGNMIPTLAASILPGAAAAKTIRSFGVLAKYTPAMVSKIATLGGAITGGTVGGGLEGTATYRSVIEAGGTEIEAARAAELMTLFSAGLNSLSVGKVLQKAGPGFKAKVVKKLGQGAWEGITEGAEEPAEVTARLAALLQTGQALPVNDAIVDLYIESLKEAATIAPIAAVTGIGAPSGGGSKKDPYTYKQGQSFKNVRTELDKVYPAMPAKEKDEMAFVASRTIGMANAPLDAVGNVLQLRTIMGDTDFRTFATNWFSATIGPGVAEEVESSPEAMVILRTLNPDLKPVEFEAHAKETVPVMNKDSEEAGIVPTLSSGMISTEAGGAKLTMDQLSKYVSPEQKTINEGKNMVEEPVGATIMENPSMAKKKLTKQQKREKKRLKEVAARKQNVSVEQHDQLIALDKAVAEGLVETPEMQAAADAFKILIESKPGSPERQQFSETLRKDVKDNLASFEKDDARGVFYTSLIEAGVKEEQALLYAEIYDNVAEASVKKGWIENTNQFYSFWMNPASINAEQHIKEATQGFSSQYIAQNQSPQQMQTELKIKDHLRALLSSERFGDTKIINTIQPIPRVFNLLQMDTMDKAIKILKAKNFLSPQVRTADMTPKQEAELKTMIVAHETGHIMHDFLFIHDPAAYKQIADFYGEDATTPIMMWDPQVQEQVADSWATFLLTGQAPNSKLKTAFEKMKAWFTAMANKMLMFKFQRDARKGDPEVTEIMKTLFDVDVNKTEPGIGEAAKDVASGKIVMDPAMALDDDFKNGLSDADKQQADFEKSQEARDKVRDATSGAGRDPDAPIVTYTHKPGTLPKEGAVEFLRGEESTESLFPEDVGTLNREARGLPVDENYTPWEPTDGEPRRPNYDIDWGLVTDESKMQEMIEFVKADEAEFLDQASRYYESLTEPADQQAYADKLNAIQENFGDYVRESTGGEQSWALLERLAAQTNVTEEQLRRMPNLGNAAEVLAYRNLFNTKKNFLHRMLKTYNDPTNSFADKEAMKPELFKTVDQYYAMMRGVMGLRAEAGRVLNSWKLSPNSKELQLEEFAEKTKDLPGVHETDKWALAMEEALEMGNEGMMVENFKAYGITDIFVELFYNSILSGPATQMRNLTGNTLNIVADAFLERPAAVMMSSLRRGSKKIIATATNKEIEEDADLVPMSEVAFNMYGFFEGVIEGLRALWKFGNMPAMEAIEELDRTADPKDMDRRVITSENFRNMATMGAITRGLEAKTPRLAGAYNAVIDNVGLALRFPSTLLGIGDKVFVDFLGYRMALNSLAYRRAWQEGKKKGWNYQTIFKKYQHIKLNPQKFKLDNKNISKKAVENAKELAFRQEITGKPGELISWLNSIRPISLILPFKSTPFNINKHVLKRIPLIHMFFDDYKNKSQAEKSIADGRAFIGASAVAALMWAIMGEPPEDKTVAEGVQFPLITGRGPENKQLRKTMERMGWQEYSIRTDTGYTTYKNMEPYSTFLAIAGETSEIFANGLKSGSDKEMEVEWDQRAAEFTVGVIGGVIHSVADKSFLTNLFDTIDIVTAESNQRSKKLLRLGQKTVTSFVPYSNLVRSIRRDVDPYMREVGTIADMMYNDIPGFTEKLPPKRNLWGEAQWYSGILEEQHGRMWSPVYSSKFPTDGDPVDAEIARLIAAGEAVRGMPNRTQSFKSTVERGAMNSHPVKLSDRKYDKLIIFMNGKTTEEGPSLMKLEIKALMATDLYKKEMIPGKRAMINTAIDDRLQAAKERIINSDREVELRQFVNRKSKEVFERKFKR